MSKHQGVWRDPPEESADLYPGLVVQDDRVSGSITAGTSRLPLWCLIGYVVEAGWAEVQRRYDPEEYGWTREKMSDFLRFLLEPRGEFARILLVLADEERQEFDRQDDASEDDRAWWQMTAGRIRVREALLACLGALDELEGG